MNWPKKQQHRIFGQLHDGKSAASRSDKTGYISSLVSSNDSGRPLNSRVTQQWMPFWYKKSRRLLEKHQMALLLQIIDSLDLKFLVTFILTPNFFHWLASNSLNQCCKIKSLSSYKDRHALLIHSILLAPISIGNTDIDRQLLWLVSVYKKNIDCFNVCPVYQIL